MIKAVLFLVAGAIAAPMVCVPQRGTCNFQCVYNDVPNKVVIELRECPFTAKSWPKAQGLDTVAQADTTHK